MEDITLAEAAFIVLSASSLGTRVIRWLWDHAQLVQVFVEVVEYIVKHRPAANESWLPIGIKNQAARSAEKRGVEDVLRRKAAIAEREVNGKDGSSTKARRVQKLKTAWSEVKRWLPIIGLWT